MSVATIRLEMLLQLQSLLSLELILGPGGQERINFALEIAAYISLGWFTGDIFIVVLVC